MPARSQCQEQQVCSSDICSIQASSWGSNNLDYHMAPKLTAERPLLLSTVQSYLMRKMQNCHSQDPAAHLKFLKPSPPANPLVDRCIECGFCESNCPSRDVTLTPRQRITVWREINRLRSCESRTPEQEQRWAPLFCRPCSAIP